MCADACAIHTQPQEITLYLNTREHSLRTVHDTGRQYVPQENTFSIPAGNARTREPFPSSGPAVVLLLGLGLPQENTFSINTLLDPGINNRFGLVQGRSGCESSLEKV